MSFMPFKILVFRQSGVFLHTTGSGKWIHLVHSPGLPQKRNFHPKYFLYLPKKMLFFLNGKNVNNFPNKQFVTLVRET